MTTEYWAPDLATYKMDYYDPHMQLESVETEREQVGQCLEALREAGIISHTYYDEARLLAMRQVVAENFELPWTSISQRIQRLLYALNAVHRPKVMLAMGVFYGFTYISNAGAAIGPGACYEADELIGVELLPEAAEGAENNVRPFDPKGVAKIVSGDAVEYARNYPSQIELLYLDVGGITCGDKALNFDILLACWDRLPKGSLILCHDTAIYVEKLQAYVDFVRDPANCSVSFNVMLDRVGLEISVK
jgi:predicted O-methyltransferase YrrM